MKIKISVLLGIMGMALCIYSNLLSSGSLIQKYYFLISAGLLLIAALIEKQAFFIILEIIIFAATLAAFMLIPKELKAAIPISLTILGIVYFAVRNLLTEFYVIVGCLGLALLAAGYAVSNPLIYCIGGILISYYSFASYNRGVKIAMLWGILNVFFTVTAAIGVYHLYF